MRVHTRILAFFTFLLSLSLQISAQQTDSIKLQLQPVEVKVYFAQQPMMSLTSSTHVLSHSTLTQQGTVSLTSAVNTVPGVRMEERSPGSYRLAMRGSLLRSAFGIRNTKIYIDEFPLTDAGGNTYLNLLDPLSIQSMHIVKGPDGSLYGANSGGVVQINPKGFGPLEDNIGVQVTAGSYELFHQQLSLQQKVSEKYQFSFDQAFLRSDGYRDHSALHKKAFQTAHQWQYSTKGQLKVFALYSDLNYQTPGGLTQAQFDANPKAARPAAGINPGAQEQDATIYNKTTVIGITNSTQISERLSHVISLFGSYTDFENPFITNYEFRKERNLGARTYFSWTPVVKSNLEWQMQVGGEVYNGWNTRKNYGNDKGIFTSLLDHDKLNNSQVNLFYRTMLQLYNRWNIEASIGYNTNKIRYEEIYPLIDDRKGEINFDGIWMPRLASSYRINTDWTIRASIATGYSTPTLEEIRPSDRIINSDLRAETGTNIESGIRYMHFSQRFLFDISAYHYNMKNGIIRQLNEAGEDFYQNAGNMKQKGLEASAWFSLVSPRSEGSIQSLHFQSAVAYNHYRFGEYEVAGNDYSGNKMTAVPDWTWSNSMQAHVLKKININLLHNFTSSLPINDANTVYAAKFHLLQAKVSYQLPKIKRSSLEVFAGADNILNEKYSLGNDINAFGGRFFNPAAARNYYAGIKLLL